MLFLCLDVNPTVKCYFLKKSRCTQQHDRVLFDLPVHVAQESFTSHTCHDNKTDLQKRAFIAWFVSWLRIAKRFKTLFDGWGDSVIGDPWSLSSISLLFRYVLVCYRLEIGYCPEQRTQRWSQGSLYLLCICTFTFSVPSGTLVVSSDGNSRMSNFGRSLPLY